MLHAYIPSETNIQKCEISLENISLLKKAVWVDLFNPTLEEVKQAEKVLGLHLPSREEMQEIEASSRLYKTKNVSYMTANMVAKSETDMPQNDAVTFILAERHFITIRYLEPQTFKLYSILLTRLETNEIRPTAIFIGLLEATIDRTADILEKMNRNLDELTRVIFNYSGHGKDIKTDYQTVLRSLGFNGDLGAKCHESLISFKRLLGFLKTVEKPKTEGEMGIKIRNLSKDIASLSEHVIFQSTKVNFLLDATLGMINIEQNNIIKIFSVAAVIFLPPTLIASFYGMNFQFMPELQWKWGYQLSMVLMLLSAWLPYRYFKHRKWL